ncbi:hypothetical protein [Cellulophaga sp. L1A9]|uniref:hypothetical protein n=1 Tax=Cellulophaga sp. L1A9 TaxID=2686362 RepID=UPI00131D6308|nr:hypothetical protein [Cellulophaga sp. L1A9]
MNKGQFHLEITKMSKVLYASPFRLLRILFLLFITSFCFHKTIGIGYSVFAVACLLIAAIMYLNWNKLVLRKVDE